MDDLDIRPDLDRDIVLFTVHGTFDVWSALRAAIDFFELHPVGRSLWDFRDADVSGLTLEEMRDAYREIRRDTGRPEDTRTALVFGGRTHAGLAQLYKAMVEAENTPVSYGVFETLEEACSWLGAEGAFND